jgi:hypothetical protein
MAAIISGPASIAIKARIAHRKSVSPRLDKWNAGFFMGPTVTACLDTYSLLRRGLLHGRRRRPLDTVSVLPEFSLPDTTMTTKRSKYDPLATSRLTRWLVLRDMFHNVLDSTELTPGTDLRTAFAAGLAALERAGWHNEGASGGMVFVRRGAERRLLAIHEHDPHEPVPAGHGAPAGRCLSCE